MCASFGIIPSLALEVYIRRFFFDIYIYASFVYIYVSIVYIQVSFISQEKDVRLTALVVYIRRYFFVGRCSSFSLKWKDTYKITEETCAYEMHVSLFCRSFL